MLINVALSVLNGETPLVATTERLDACLNECGLAAFEIVISDNGFTDHTQTLTSELAQQFNCVRTVRLNEGGRGRA